MAVLCLLTRGLSRYADGLQRLATVRVARTCDLLVLMRDDLVDVLKLFPRHQVRAWEAVAYFVSDSSDDRLALMRTSTPLSRHSTSAILI